MLKKRKTFSLFFYKPITRRLAHFCDGISCGSLFKVSTCSGWIEMKHWGKGANKRATYVDG